MKLTTESINRFWIVILFTSPLLVIAFAWLLRQVLPQGEAMTLREMEQKAYKLAGPSAVSCGPFSFGMQTNTSYGQGLACEVAAFRKKQQFCAGMDSGEATIFNTGRIVRIFTVSTPQGKVIELKCQISRQPRPDDLVKVIERECRNPRVQKLWPQGPEGLACDG